MDCDGDVVCVLEGDRAWLLDCVTLEDADWDDDCVCDDDEVSEVVWVLERDCV